MQLTPRLSRSQAIGLALWSILACELTLTTYYSLVPTVPKLIESIWDKLLHASAYFLLSSTLFFCAAWRPHWRSPNQKRGIFLSFLFPISWGGSIELFQAFSPKRHFSFLILFADALGALIGVSFCLFLESKLGEHTWNS